MTQQQFESRRDEILEQIPFEFRSYFFSLASKKGYEGYWDEILIFLQCLITEELKTAFILYRENLLNKTNESSIYF